MQILSISSPEGFYSIDGIAALSELSFETIASHKPYQTLVAVEGGAAEAVCSIWVHNTPEIAGQTNGIIGHWADNSTDAAMSMLEHACSLLEHLGCTDAIGPMNGNTWRSYRFATMNDAHPPFFIEPTNPQSWPEHFMESGFKPIANYSSGLTKELTWADPRLARVEKRLSADGIVLRTLDKKRFDDELSRIYKLSLESFRQNFLYTPIDEAEFVGMYQQVIAYIDPDMVLLAEDAGETVGFLFAVPDIAQKVRGEIIDTIIIKTVAVKPGRRYAGLGALLVEKCMHAAATAGYVSAIHALMHDANHSRNISGHTAKTIRQYTLFAKALSQ
jgi:GNAT superfamily N-acetyltransferase